jgi:hypothetical protein
MLAFASFCSSLRAAQIRIQNPLVGLRIPSADPIEANHLEKRFCDMLISHSSALTPSGLTSSFFGNLGFD